MFSDLEMVRYRYVTAVYKSTKSIVLIVVAPFQFCGRLFASASFISSTLLATELLAAAADRPSTAKRAGQSFETCSVPLSYRESFRMIPDNEDYWSLWGLLTRLLVVLRGAFYHR